MKQYTNETQTAKLIELGFEKPSPNFYQNGVTWIQCEGNYSIGELIEMLPEKITVDGWNYSRVISENEICYYFGELEVYFCICDINIQLIDNLFDAIVRLKEEGLI